MLNFRKIVLGGLYTMQFAVYDVRCNRVSLSSTLYTTYLQKIAW